MAVAKKKLFIIGLLILAGVLAIVRFVLMRPVQEEGAEMVTGTTETTQQKDIVPSSVEGGQMMGGNNNTLMGQKMMDANTASVTTHYNNPGGVDDVSFTLVVDDSGVITKAETGILAQGSTAKMRQESFAAAFPAVLVGKKLSEIEKVDRVGGSSLTTNAFNASLPKLKEQL